MYQDTERKVQASGIKSSMLDASKFLGFGSGRKTEYFSVFQIIPKTKYWLQPSLTEKLTSRISSL